MGQAASGDNGDPLEAATSAAASALWAIMLADVFEQADMLLSPPAQPSQSLALPLRMAVIGPPGGGCSTLAHALAERFNLKVRPTAPMLNRLVPPNTVLAPFTSTPRCNKQVACTSEEPAHAEYTTSLQVLEPRSLLHADCVPECAQPGDCTEVRLPVTADKEQTWPDDYTLVVSCACSPCMAPAHAMPCTSRLLNVACSGRRPAAA